MGVDLFFVLSGFLITGVLRKDSENPSYWKRFYVKRATRILPALLITLLLTFVFVPGVRLTVLLGYCATLGGLLDLHTATFIEAVGPLWSLAVEEHFYLIWPFAIRYLNRTQQLMLLGGLIIGTPLLRFAASHPMPTADLSVIYFLTPFRMDEMAYGCLLALMIESPRIATMLRRWSGLSFLLTGGLYLALWVHLQHIYFYPGGHTKLFDSIGYSLVALASTALLSHLYLNEKCAAGRILSWPPLAWLGKVSYGVYLYHILIRTAVMAALHVSSQRIAFLFDLPLILVLSWLSFRYYEEPLMAWGRRRLSEIAGSKKPAMEPFTTEAGPEIA
jgi:peptidoglycan/LPS O-acetylase OafA/YrhL